MYWELAGNKVVTGMTAFLGTTSPHPLRIRTNTAVPTQPVGTQPKLDAQEAMRITPFQPGPTPQRGSVGIWTDAPRRALHVQGSEIHSGGAVAGFSFGNRETPDPFSVPVPNNGERWVWYASGGTARLWSLTDKIAVTPAGNVGIGTTSPENKRLAIQGGELISFKNTTSATKWHINDWNGSTLGSGDLNIAETGVADGRLYLKAGGNIGIGTTTPVFRLDVAGSAHASSFPTSSDARLKTNVKQLTNVLDKLEKIRAVSFQWNDLCESLGRSTGRTEIGVIGQEVKTVFPELVTAWGDESYEAVDYGRLTGILVEAVKELKADNEALRSRIEALEQA